MLGRVAQRVCISMRLLALLMHALLRSHWIRALRLLLLEVGLVLQGLLLVGGHIRLGGCRVAHTLRRHGLRHGRCGGVLLLGRLDSGLAVGAIRVGGLGRVQARLSRCQ